MSRSVPFVVALAVLGCRTDDESPVASSATLVASSDGESLYALNVDEGTLSRMSVDGLRVETVPAGDEPTRLTRAGRKVWVTLRGERGVVAFEDTKGGLVEVARAEVGAEPYGTVALSDGSRVYVALSMEDRVVELDGVTLEELRSFPVLDEPRWLALNRGETALFVASARDGRFTRIDLDSGETSNVRLPGTGTRGGDSDPDDKGEVTIHPVGGHIDLDLIVTGDPAVSADGGTLGVPVVYADTTTPVVSATGEEGDDGGGGGGYASSGVGASRFNAALVLVPLDEFGEVVGDMKPVFLGADGQHLGTLRSYPTGVGAHPDGRYFVVTMEASNAALVVDTEPFRGQGDDPDRKTKGPVAEIAPDSLVSPLAGFTPSMLGFWDRPITAIETGTGPRGVAFVGNQLYVHSFLDRQIGWVDWDDVSEVNRHAARDRKLSEEDDPEPVLDLTDRVVLEHESALPDDVRIGRKLFYSAVDRDITTKGGGVSCSTCHVDGRTDGRTWTFAETADPEGKTTQRQTPSLAGKASETAPFTWDGNVASVADEAMLTSHDRMGGRGLDKDQVLAIAAFVDSTRTPDLPTRGVTSDLVLQGQAIFQREDVGCASCHAGARFTDGLNHAVFGSPSNTPTLTGIAATAPYLHDGSARTLRDVLVWARGGTMGDTSMLSDAELDALEAYLKSL